MVLVQATRWFAKQGRHLSTWQTSLRCSRQVYSLWHCAVRPLAFSCSAVLQSSDCPHL